MCIVSDGVPEAVDIDAGLIKRLKLDVKDWTQMIEDVVKEKYIENRFNRIEEAKAAGYDIKETAKEMQMFYLKASKES